MAYDGSVFGCLMNHFWAISLHMLGGAPFIVGFVAASGASSLLPAAADFDIALGLVLHRAYHS